MTGRPDPKLALSQVETEALRQLRTRLNKPPVSDAASVTLGRAFFQVIARSDLTPADGAGLSVVEATLGKAPSALVEEIRAAAGMANLNLLLGVLHTRLAEPAAWRALQLAGAPQAVISRRLQLASRKPDADVSMSRPSVEESSS